MTYRLKPGINECTNEEYHGDKNYLSSSSLKSVLKDLELYHREAILGEKREVPRKLQNAYDEGSFTHTLILEPHMVDKEYRFYPGMRKSGNEWEKFKKENEGFTILSKAQKHRVEKMIEGYNKRPEASKLIEGCKFEHTLAGELNDVNIKVRADAINIEKGYIADVKTTGGDSDLDNFKWKVEDFSYELSADLYCRMFEQYYNKPFDFYFIVLSKKTYLCDVFKMSKETRSKGKKMVEEALVKYKKAKDSGIWIESDKKTIDLQSENYEVKLI